MPLSVPIRDQSSHYHLRKRLRGVIDAVHEQWACSAESGRGKRGAFGGFRSYAFLDHKSMTMKTMVITLRIVIGTNKKEGGFPKAPIISLTPRTKRNDARDMDE
jgi:hypothetical protein